MIGIDDAMRSVDGISMLSWTEFFLFCVLPEFFVLSMLLLIELLFDEL